MAWASFILATLATAPPSWLVAPLAAHGVEPSVELTFRELLATALTEAGVACKYMEDFRTLPCDHRDCALDIAATEGVDWVVVGRLSRFGDKVRVVLSLVDRISGTQVREAHVTAETVSELDAAADRLAAELYRVSSPPEVSTPAPSTDDVDSSGFAFRLGALMPLSNAYGPAGAGGLVDLAYWYEVSPHLAIEPRASVRFDALSAEGSYMEGVVDLGFFGFAHIGLITPFVGAGLGGRILHRSQPESIQIGEHLVASGDGDRTDSVLGVGAFGRAGLILLRTSSLHVSAAAEYGVTFANVGQDGNPQAICATLGVSFQ